MIQNERFGTGLKDYLPYTKIVDQTKTSDQYFRLFDVPDKLYVGKNSFRIRINRDTLVKGSLLYIDIVDSTGEIIFHEITELTGEDGSRLIVVHVYEDTPPGEATIYIGGRASYDTKNRRQLSYSTDPASGVDYLDFPNLIWAGKVIVIPTNETENEIIFAKPPTIKIKERFEEYRTYSPTEKRKIEVSGSLKVSINPIVSAYEYSDISKSGTKTSENSLQIILDPIITDASAESRQESIPQYSDIPTLYDANGNFTEDYKGGQIIIRNLTNQLNVAGVIVPDFSCSIVDVIDVNNVKIWPSFNFPYGERNGSVFNIIKDATDVTASYYTTKTDLVTNDSESFMQLEFENLEPIAGKVDSVALSYKPFGTFGEFLPIGQFKVKPQEYLIDSSSLVISKTELVEKELGRLTGSGDFDTYWETIPGKYQAATAVNNDGQFANQGVIIKTANEINPDYTYDYKLKLKNGYGINVIPNTEFKLSFTLNIPATPGIRNNENFQLDVFISGSSILRDTINNKDSIELISDSSEGTRISSLTKKSAGAVETYTYYFKTLTAGKIYPVFVFKNPIYLSIKNISIQPRNEFGYSPNQARLFVPLETLKTNTELVLNIDYLTKKGDRSKISSQVYGLFFTGSGIPNTIVSESLAKNETFTLVSESTANSSVKTDGTTLYSYNPLTSNFSKTGSIFLGSFAGDASNLASHSIFLGTQAGRTAINARNSNFIGYYAGYEANNALNSNFIGYQAGINAINANNSNFIGELAGAFAGTSSYSNYIGYQAGYESTFSSQSNFIGYFAGYLSNHANNSNFIGNLAGALAYSGSYSNFIGFNAGYNANSSSYSTFIGFRAGEGYSPDDTLRSAYRNNIVIGSGIGLADRSVNQINIGGLIFGTGSYFPSNPTTTPIFSGSADGKIGINQPMPKYTLDVSGSGNYTYGLIASASLQVAGQVDFPIKYVDGTSRYVYTDTDYTVIAGQSMTITLPRGPQGRICVIRNYADIIGGGYSVSVTGSQGADYVEGSITAYTLSSGTSVTFQLLGTNWYIISR